LAVHRRGRERLKAGNVLRALGFDVEEVDVGELEIAEAGLTCMSLISDGS